MRTTCRQSFSSSSCWAMQSLSTKTIKGIHSSQRMRCHQNSTRKYTKYLGLRPKQPFSVGKTTPKVTNHHSKGSISKLRRGTLGRWTISSELLTIANLPMPKSDDQMIHIRRPSAKRGLAPEEVPLPSICHSLPLPSQAYGPKPCLRGLSCGLSLRQRPAQSCYRIQ